MIKLFKIIRKDLMEQNKTSKPTSQTGRYFKYAIGEILLVVIGILIALQINTWNQNRVNKQKERLLLNELHNEFVKNKKQFELIISKHKDALKSNNDVIAMFPINPKTINLDSLEEKRTGWASRYTFNPSQGVIKSLINTSSFELISDHKLRKLLISWEDVLADYQEEEIYAVATIKDYIGPKILDNIPLGNVKDERFDTSFLASFEFENMHKLRMNHLLNIIDNNEGELDAIRQTIDKIIELSKPIDND